MRKIEFTKKGFEKLKSEYQELLNLRPKAVEELKRARELGDLSENGLYKAARTNLSFIDRMLTGISQQLKQAVIIEKRNKDIVEIGSKVTLIDGNGETTFDIVGELESDPSEGKISLLSPIGEAIRGKKTGDKVIIQTPKRKIIYEIVKIK